MTGEQEVLIPSRANGDSDLQNIPHVRWLPYRLNTLAG